MQDTTSYLPLHVPNSYNYSLLTHSNVKESVDHNIFTCYPSLKDFLRKLNDKRLMYCFSFSSICVLVLEA